MPDLIDTADDFAARLAIELRDEPDNRHQGMPSDGDSRPGFAAMGSGGWIGLHWPAELGGRGLSPLATVEVEERFGYHWLPLSGYLLSVKTIGNALLACASEAINERFLPEIAAGRLLFCQGFSEPEAGSDLAALRTTARQEGDRFVVSGRKIWTSSAQVADWIYLAARTDPDAARPHRGISVLVADMHSPGIEVRAIPTLGGGLLCEVLLEDVEVPADQLVGDLHGGWQVLMRTLDHERVTSEKIGVVCRVLDDLAVLIGGGSPSGRLDVSRLRGEVEAARLLGRRAAEQLAAGRPAAAASSMAKLSISGLVGRTAELGARLLGPEALVDSGTHSAAGRVAALTRGLHGQHDRRRGRGDPAPRYRAPGLGLRGMNGAPAAELGHEARLFADTIAAAVSRHAAADPWLPGAAVSDASPGLDAALALAGWEELADERMLALVGPACAALGRGYGPLAPVDALLGGVLRSGDLARYAHPRADGARLVAPREGRLEYAAGVRLVALPYTDALGIARVAESRQLGALDGTEAERRMLAWAAGSTGYLAGLSQEALRLTLEHARSRIAFGKPLSALEPVQQMLAEAATLIEGLVLLAGHRPGLNALVHAGAAAERALGICLQVTGALGFTLEFPLQRAHRRARAARCWADAVLIAWEPAT